MQYSGKLRLGISPCPNDTFIFHALVHGLVTLPDGVAGSGIAFDTWLADVEELNAWALAAGPDVCKVSAGCAGALTREYALLRSGGALGRGVGPVLVAAGGRDAGGLDGARVALPGARTTAARLFELWCRRRGITPVVEQMVFSEVANAVASGRADAGVLIHEGRFTHADLGLRLLADLGAFWEQDTGLPVPLGVIAVRRGLGPELGRALEASVRASLEYAQANPEASAAWVRENAQELDAAVIQRHIETFVTDHSLDLGEEGAAALGELLGRDAAGLFV